MAARGDGGPQYRSKHHEMFSFMQVYTDSYKANSILYFTLNYGLELAKYMNDDSVQVDYTNKMRGIKEAANERLWNATAGLFNDNDTGFTVNPQDGNVWSIKSGVADIDKIQTISSSLRTRWDTYGAPAPEVFDTTAPPPYKLFLIKYLGWCCYLAIHFQHRARSPHDSKPITTGT